MNRTKFAPAYKSAGAAAFIGLDVEGLSENALEYLAFAFDVAHGAWVESSGKNADERVESATAIFMVKLVALDRRMGGRENTTAAVAEIHARPNEAQAAGRELDQMPRGFYVLQIAGRIIWRVTHK